MLLPTLICTTNSWKIFNFDANSPNCHGKQQSTGDAGVYILLWEGKGSFMPVTSLSTKYWCWLPDGSPIEVHPTDVPAHPYQPTHTNTPTRVSLLAFRYSPSKQKVLQADHYHQCTCNRDGQCLISSQQSSTWHWLKTAHIYIHVYMTLK